MYYKEVFRGVWCLNHIDILFYEWCQQNFLCSVLILTALLGCSVSFQISGHGFHTSVGLMFFNSLIVLNIFGFSLWFWEMSSVSA